MKKLVSAGEILVEIMAEQIGQSFREPGPLLGPYPSGAPAIFIGQAAALGQPAGLIGAVGDDDFGHLNIERLRALGADVSAISIHPSESTGTAFVTYRPDGSRHFVFNIRNSAAGLVEISTAAKNMLADADHIHVMGSSLFSDRAIEVILSAMEQVKAKGGTVSFDPNIRREIMDASGMRQALDRVLALTDIFLPSGEELFLFTSSKDETAAVSELLNRGVSCVILKKGASGAVYHDRHGAVTSSGFTVDEVDPTGAGDCFGAAFVSMQLRGALPAEALQIANACGALAVTRKGPMEGIFPLAAVEAFIATADRKSPS